MDESYSHLELMETREIISQDTLAELSQPPLSEAQELCPPLHSTEEHLYVSDEAEAEPMEVDQEEEEEQEQEEQVEESKKVESPEAKAARFLKEYEKSCQEAWSTFIGKLEEECDLERLPSSDTSKPTRRQKYCLYCKKRVPLKHEHLEEGRRMQGGNVLHLTTRIVESEI